MLFLPAPRHLTGTMKQAVRDFRAGGGIVIEQRASWQWHDPNGGQEKAIHAFTSAIFSVAKTAPVQVFGGHEKMHAVSFASREGRRLTVSLSNDFAWVYTGRKPAPEKIAALTQTPPPCKGVEVVVRGRGVPREVFDAVSGKTLSVRRARGSVEIAVPDFEHMAVVVVRY